MFVLSFCTSVVRGPPGRLSSLVCRSDWCWGLVRSGRVGLVERRTGMIARAVVGSGEVCLKESRLNWLLKII
jgi:hypothetical protein